MKFLAGRDECAIRRALLPTACQESGFPHWLFDREPEQNRTVTAPAYKLVRLRNGTQAVHDARYGELMHPGLGPAEEAELIYVQQSKVRERIIEEKGGFIVWDVGLGAAANALTLFRLTRDIACPLHVVSFDDTSAPLEFALANAVKLGYFHGYQTSVRHLLEKRSTSFNDGEHRVRWEFLRGDFPSFLVRSHNHPTDHSLPAPHAIFFDAFSPPRNPAMWTLPLFKSLFLLLDPARSCSLTTYSRSTMVRVTLLLAGFFVGRGLPAGLKEETTVAANTLDLVEEPLERMWLEQARRSANAQPLVKPAYCQSRLSPKTWQKLQAHPQFQL